MNVILVALGGIAAALVITLIIGLLIPPVRTASAVIEIHTPPEHAWKILTDWKGQPAWRSELSRVEVVSPERFLEYPKHGRPIAFRVVSVRAPERIELEMSGAVFGRYVATLTAHGDTTLFRAEETITTANPLMRIAGRLFFDLDAFATRYAAELKLHAESGNAAVLASGDAFRQK